MDNQIWLSRTEHDFNSPSRLSLRMDCPGSARLERQTEKGDCNFNKPTSDTERGKNLHALGVKHLNEKLDLDMLCLNLTIEDREQLRWAIERTKEIIKRFAAHQPVVQYETQIDLSSLGISGGIHGCRIDVLIIIPRIGFCVIDWKFGSRPVDSPLYNPQFWAYGWGVWKKFGGNGELIKLQPMAYGEDSYQISVFEDKEFEEVGAKIKAIVAATHAEDTPLIRGPHCVNKFCNLRKSICPLWKESLLEIPDGKSVANYFTMISPQRRGEFLDRIKTILQVAKHCESVAEELALRNNLNVEGYEIGPGRSSYICTDLDRFKNELSPFTSAKELPIDCLITPPVPAMPKAKSDVEKILGKSKEVMDIIKSLYLVKPGEPRLKKKRVEYRSVMKVGT